MRAGAVVLESPARAEQCRPVLQQPIAVGSHEHVFAVSLRRDAARAGRVEEFIEERRPEAEEVPAEKRRSGVAMSVKTSNAARQGSQRDRHVRKDV